ncbi:ubiquitin-like protein [Cystobasidium minutum MCA 4210]|uniref:ubiquitin-like protein n=1 Tax=Cystobasidium minutum MCA 4210 TaxID=1397322 RepID=UPI0034CE6E7A|eukprot:jgi/Rhomi1/165259/fgenesh1_kg.1_\
MSATPEPPAGEDRKPDNKIEIRVAFPNDNELVFRVKKTTPFEKIMQSIATQKDIDRKSFTLAFDGTRINANETPKMLEMSDGDQIDVQLTQVGGAAL